MQPVTYINHRGNIQPDVYPSAYGNPFQPMVNPVMKRLKWAVWLYFLLVIFEGALRKWFLPSLATPLLVVRDPIALWGLVVAWRQGILPINGYIRGICWIGVISVVFALVFGHHNLLVALYGVRILLIHFPFMFVVGTVLTRQDLLQIGKVTLWIAIPMTALIAIQFNSPQSAWVNLGVGGDEGGAGFSGVGDYKRPPGTFSFTSGLTSFYSFVAPFIVYFWLATTRLNKLILIGATVALLAAIPLSISRTLFFQVIVTCMFTMLILVRNPKYGGRLLLAGLGIGVLFYVLSGTSLFATSAGAFTERFETANETEGGLDGVLIDRFLGGMWGTLTNISAISLFGLGIGMGTNVGAMLLSGSLGFLISEGEWGRTVGELGPLLGLAVIFIRISLVIRVTRLSYFKLASGDILPWLLLSNGLLLLLQGGWAQPTSLGFCIMGGGILIASLNHQDQPVETA